MGYCLGVIGISAVRAGSCNLVVGVCSGSILVSLPSHVLAIVLHKGYFTALKFGIPILLNVLVSRKWKLNGSTNWKRRESG
jgi:hypothetical protein